MFSRPGLPCPPARPHAACTWLPRARCSGGGSWMGIEEDAIRALRSKNILLVAAAGNEEQNLDTTPSYPASYNLDNIIAGGQ